MPDSRDPFTAMATAAVAMHELFVEYVKAGFSEEHAIYLVACMASGGPNHPPAAPQRPR